MVAPEALPSLDRGWRVVLGLGTWGPTVAANKHELPLSIIHPSVHSIQFSLSLCSSSSTFVHLLSSIRSAKMRFVSAVLVFAAGALAASSATAATSTGTGCAAQVNFDACLQSTTQQVTNCPATDYACMCQAQKAVITCYNLCPNNPQVGTAQGSESSWCGAASQVASTMSTTVGAPAQTASSAVNVATASTTGGTFSTGTAKANAAAPIAGSGSGLLAAAIIAAMI